MTRTRIQPASLRDPVRYSLGWKVGNTLYLAGALGADPEGRFSPDIKDQTRRAWQNIDAVVKEAGGRGVQDVVQVTVFITDMRYRQAQGEVRSELFEPGRLPASTLIQCVALADPEAFIEIEGIAVIDE
ncbi:MAG: RidA family protein [Chloroflexi bacterium]|nr:RidA family protein [Chloroflexota bacterium]